MIKIKNNIVEDISKYINYNYNYSLFLKYIKISKRQKLIDSIYRVIKKLKLFYKVKIDPIKRAIK